MNPPPENGQPTGITVSVVMPAYNAEDTVGGAVRSVLTQSYRDFELIVVDDCSTDGTAGVVGRLIAGEPRARLYRNEINQGAARSRNLGVAAARGEWVAFLDSDDLWREDKLQRQMDFICETGAAISYTASAFMDSGGVPRPYVMPAEYKLTYGDLLRRNLMSCSSVIVRRDIMARVGMAGDALHEDYAAWLKILGETGCAYGLNEPLLTYRLSRNSKSGGRIKSGLMILRTYRYAGYGAAAALLLTLRYSLHSIRKRYLIRGR